MHGCAAVWLGASGRLKVCWWAKVVSLLLPALARLPASPASAPPTAPAPAFHTPCRLLVESRPPYRLAWANPAWEELAGLDWHEVVGQPCLDVVAGSLARAEGAPAGLVDALAAHARGGATVELLQVRVGCARAGVGGTAQVAGPPALPGPPALQCAAGTSAW